MFGAEDSPCTAPHVTWGRQAVGSLSLLTPNSHNITFHLRCALLIALWVYNTRFAFHPVPRPWGELTLMACQELIVRGTDCMAGWNPRRHPEEKGGAARGWDFGEDSRLPFLEASPKRMGDSLTGITKFYVWKGPSKTCCWSFLRMWIPWAIRNSCWGPDHWSQCGATEEESLQVRILALPLGRIA